MPFEHNFIYSFPFSPCLSGQSVARETVAGSSVRGRPPEPPRVRAPPPSPRMVCSPAKRAFPRPKELFPGHQTIKSKNRIRAFCFTYCFVNKQILHAEKNVLLFLNSGKQVRRRFWPGYDSFCFELCVEMLTFVHQFAHRYVYNQTLKWVSCSAFIFLHFIFSKKTTDTSRNSGEMKYR